MSGYRNVPPFIRDQIRNCTSETFYVARTREYSREDLEKGALAHLGVDWSAAGLQCPEAPVVPPATRGRWSKYNIDGWVKVRKDLPKIKKTIGGWLSPNFGDWKKGSHVHYSTREVFQRETWYAQRIPIQIRAEEPSKESVNIGFIVDRVFNRTDLVDRDLLMACSLLRENIGTHVAILATDTSVAEWLASQRVKWELLPVGELGQKPFSQIAKRFKLDPDSPRAKHMSERYDTVLAMKPTNQVIGDGEFSRYFGFMFRDDLVALECLDYGNALYVMYEEWKELSKRSRVDLLADTTARYDRVIHRKGWHGRLGVILRENGHDPGDLVE
ncbi:hypothetical protein [Mycobacteroides abscessus]|uniref:hypothetical protein n=1 Tax=Mycobacteroides abscessus TaxID=36809 RepID=UPI0012FFF9AA|nr:hypothetical protein [Mycobacteroides abscessus]